MQLRFQCQENYQRYLLRSYTTKTDPVNSLSGLNGSKSNSHNSIIIEYVAFYLRRTITTLQDYNINQNKFSQSYYHP